MTKRIAFLQFGAAGDILFATPILRHLKDLNLDSEINWYVRDVFANLVETNPHVDRVVPYILPNTYGQKQQDEGEMWNQMKVDAKHRGEYDMVVKPQMWPDHNFYRSQRHIVDMMAENVFCLDYQLPEPCYLELNIVMDDMDAVDKRFNPINWRRVVTINHISYAASAVWPPEKYVKLAEELIDHEFIPMFAGAIDDPIPGVEGILDARGTSYREWAECIERSAFWFGLDTGAKGIAATTVTPMCVLQSPDFQVHKTGIATRNLCAFGKPIFELTIPITVSSAMDIIIGNAQ